MKKVINSKLFVVSVICILVLALSGLGYAEDIEWKEMVRWEVNDEGEFIEDGLRLADDMAHDGKWEVVTKDGRYAVETVRSHGWMFLYFAIDDDIIHDLPAGTPVKVEIDYYDEGMGSVVFGPTSHLSNDYHWTDPVRKEFADEWKTCEFRLNQAKFDSSGHGRYDFRIQAGDRHLAISRISIFLDADFEMPEREDVDEWDGFALEDLELGEVLLFENFEDDLHGWDAAGSVGDTYAYDGDRSFETSGENRDWLTIELFDQPQAAVYEIWFYDTMEENLNQVVAVGSSGSDRALLGVQTQEGDGDSYIYSEVVHAGWKSTGIERTEGWHKLTFAFNGSGVVCYINDEKVFEDDRLGKAHMIMLGDPWGPEGIGYWDSVTITEVIE